MPTRSRSRDDRPRGRSGRAAAAKAKRLRRRQEGHPTPAAATGEPDAKPDLPSPGDELELDMESIGHGGDAVGRASGLVVFVPFGAPADRLRVKTTEVKRSFVRARITEILRPSPQRVDPRCPVFMKCGGCHLQHLSADQQLASRRQALQDTLERIAKISEPDVRDAVSAEDPWGYRHRITLHAEPRGSDGKTTTIGYVGIGGRRIVPVSACPIAHPVFAPIVEALAFVSGDVTGVSGKIELRTGYPAEHVHVFFSPGTEALVSPVLRRLQSVGAEHVMLRWSEGSIRKCAPKARPTPLTFATPWATWNLPPHAFYQVHPELAIRLAEQVAAWANPGPTDLAVDLYAGIGFLAAAFAGDAKMVWCLEGHFGSVRAGEAAIRRAGISNVRFVPGPVEARFPTMNFPDQLALAVLDPPREGASEGVVKALLRYGPPRIIYVSCDPATLARDVRRLAAGGYRHVRSVPYDFFPQTYHFESVTLLERG